MSGLYMAEDPACICVPRCTSLQRILRRISFRGAFGKPYKPYTGYMWWLAFVSPLGLCDPSEERCTNIQGGFAK